MWCLSNAQAMILIAVIVIAVAVMLTLRQGGLAAQHYISYASFVFLHYGVIAFLAPPQQIQLRFFFIRVFACFPCFFFSVL